MAMFEILKSGDYIVESMHMGAWFIHTTTFGWRRQCCAAVEPLGSGTWADNIYARIIEPEAS